MRSYSCSLNPYMRGRHLSNPNRNVLTVDGVSSSNYVSVSHLVFIIGRKKGLKTPSRRFLFGMTLAMFVYATVDLSISIGNLILFIRGFFLDVEARGSKGDAAQLFSAIGLINVRRVPFVL